MCLCIYLQDSCPLCLYFLIFFIFWCAQDVSGSHPSSSGWVPPAINTLQVKSGLCTDVSPFRWHHYHSVKGTATLQKRRGDFYFIKLTLHYLQRAPTTTGGTREYFRLHVSTMNHQSPEFLSLPSGTRHTVLCPHWLSPFRAPLGSIQKNYWMWKSVQTEL